MHAAHALVEHGVALEFFTEIHGGLLLRFIYFFNEVRVGRFDFFFTKCAEHELHQFTLQKLFRVLLGLLALLKEVDRDGLRLFIGHFAAKLAHAGNDFTGDEVDQLLAVHVNVMVLDELRLDELPAHRLLGVGPLGLDFDRIQWLLARGGHPLFEEVRGELELRFHQLVAGEVKEVLLGVAQVDLGQFFFDFRAESSLVGHNTLPKELVKELGVQCCGLDVVDLLELESEVARRQRVFFGVESENLVDVKVLFEVAHVDDQTVTFGEGLEVLLERASAHRVEAEAAVLMGSTFYRLTLLGDDVEVSVEQVVVAGGLDLAHGAVALAKVFDFFI